MSETPEPTREELAKFAELAETKPDAHAKSLGRVYRLALEALDRRAEFARLAAKVAEQAAEIERLRVTRNPDHDTCRAVEQRLREANRRLQAEGPALERDKLIAAQQAKLAEAEAQLRAVEALRDDLLAYHSQAEKVVAAKLTAILEAKG